MTQVGNVLSDFTVQVSVIVLAHGDEPYLRASVDAILASLDGAGKAVDLELILIDNGASAAVAGIGPDPRMSMVRPQWNLGFAGGCNAGAGHARGRDLVFVNSDAIVAPDAIHVLTSALTDPGLGIVTAAVRLADKPDLMNTVGNPVHYLGVVWAGGFGEPHEQHAVRTDVASASGAFFAVRHDRWDELGGFDDQYFAYHEDTDLSLRVWQRGYRVQYEPDAVARHHYEFSRNPTKQYLLERNRWITVLTVFPGKVLAGVLPALLAFEVPLCALALSQGWLGDKLRSYRWLVAHHQFLRQRRRRVQDANRISPAEFCQLLSSRIEPAMVERPRGFGVLNVILHLYWTVFRTVARLR
jgi:GT2 family glycosyltransferase